MDNWFLLGDIHGDTGPLYVFYKSEKERLNLDNNKNYMILLGDVIIPKELVDKLSVDEIYFVSTGGGVVFGGGEPLLNASYILETVKLMPEMWAKRIETSLNVEWAKMAPLVSQIDQWIVDIKDYSEKNI